MGKIRFMWRPAACEHSQVTLCVSLEVTLTLLCDAKRNSVEETRVAGMGGGGVGGRGVRGFGRPARPSQ